MIPGLLLAALVTTASLHSDLQSAGAAQDPAATVQDGSATTRSAVESTEATVVVPEADERDLRFYRADMWIWSVGVLVSMLVPAFVLFTGVSGRLWAQISGWIRPWPVAAALFSAAYFTLAWLLELPLSFWRAYAHPHEFGLSNQTLAEWLGDVVKQHGFTLLLAALVVPPLYALMKASPRRWWLYTGLLGAAVTAFVVLIEPILVAPAFDEFGPMQDQALEARILDMADRAGVEADRVYEVDKSEDTEQVNAYVAGILGTSRIVLWDTLIQKFETPHVLVVVGHELGHYVLGHTWYFIVGSSLILLLTLWVAHRTMGPLVSRHRHRIGFERIDTPASLPLLLLVSAVVGFVTLPVQNAFSRSREREADRFALEMLRDNYTQASFFVIGDEVNLGNPRPGWIYRTFRATHPSIADRVRFANHYRPWESGAPLRYGHLFAEEPTGALLGGRGLALGGAGGSRVGPLR